MFLSSPHLDHQGKDKAVGLNLGFPSPSYANSFGDQGIRLAGLFTHPTLQSLRLSFSAQNQLGLVNGRTNITILLSTAATLSSCNVECKSVPN